METFEAHDRRECRKLKVARGFSSWNYKKQSGSGEVLQQKSGNSGNFFLLGSCSKNSTQSFNFGPLPPRTHPRPDPPGPCLDAWRPLLVCFSIHWRFVLP